MGFLAPLFWLGLSGTPRPPVIGLEAHFLFPVVAEARVFSVREEPIENVSTETTVMGIQKANRTFGIVQDIRDFGITNDDY